MIDVIQERSEKLQTLVSSPQVSFNGNLHGELPSKAGVYRIFEPSSDLHESIYVGTTGNLKERVHGNLLIGDSQAHTLKRKLMESSKLGDEKSVKEYLKSKCKIQYLVIPDEKERVLFEHFTISILKPKYND